MKYLMNCKTLEELKKAYRAFTKKLHPDCGGTKEEMQQLNDEYEKMFNLLKNQHNATADAEHQTTETPFEFMNIIEKLVKMQGLEVELCGSWIWVRGNTYEYRDTLKEMGFKWSNSKKSWHWHHATVADLNRKHWHYSMDKIRQMHGSQIFSQEPQAALA